MISYDGWHVSLFKIGSAWHKDTRMFEVSIISISLTIKAINFTRSLLMYAYDPRDYNAHTFNVLFLSFGF